MGSRPCPQAGSGPWPPCGVPPSRRGGDPYGTLLPEGGSGPLSRGGTQDHDVTIMVRSLHPSVLLEVRGGVSLCLRSEGEVLPLVVPRGRCSPSVRTDRGEELLLSSSLTFVCSVIATPTRLLVVCTQCAECTVQSRRAQYVTVVFTLCTVCTPLDVETDETMSERYDISCKTHERSLLHESTKVTYSEEGRGLLSLT